MSPRSIGCAALLGAFLWLALVGLALVLCDLLYHALCDWTHVAVGSAILVLALTAGALTLLVAMRNSRPAEPPGRALGAGGTPVGVGAEMRS